ncbi:hypothetical protein WJX82_002482 [Trebouxia sp. C0006]
MAFWKLMCIPSVSAQPCSNDANLLLEAPWAQQVDWNLSVATSNWTGVSCSGAFVSQVELPPPSQDPNFEGGEEPPPGNAAKHLEQPYKVITIDLGNNRLTGTLPSFWSVLTQMLKLSLGDNLLTGTLPSSWSNITFLSQPSLLGNKLTRTWPVSWNTMIWWGEVRLQDNEFFGALPRLDSSMHVGLLYLQNNNFSRPLPESWSNTIKTFSVWGEMNFSSNHLTGTVPDTLPSSSLEMVHSLDLSNNDLSGTLPSSLGSLAWCEELNINNSFTGTTPEAWSNLTNTTS